MSPFPLEAVMAKTEDEEAFFNAYGRFLDDHDACPDVDKHFQYYIWLPTDSDACAFALSCACGARIVLPTTRKVGKALVASLRLSGVPVMEYDGPDGIQ